MFKLVVIGIHNNLTMLHKRNEKQNNQLKTGKTG